MKQRRTGQSDIRIVVRPDFKRVRAHISYRAIASSFIPPWPANLNRTQRKAIGPTSVSTRESKAFRPVGKHHSRYQEEFIIMYRLRTKVAHWATLSAVPAISVG